MTAFDILRIFVPATIAFLFGIGITPLVTYFLYKYKMWKPKGGKVALDGTPASVFNSLHEKKEVGTPRFGGVIVWLSVVLTAVLLQVLWLLYPEAFEQLAFISRDQTWVPLATLLTGALVGLLDDFYEVRGKPGIPLRYRLIVVAIISALSAWWFYDKLGVSSVSMPFGIAGGLLNLGLLFIPFFVLVALFIYAGGVIDGLDGLAGGLFATMFGAYAGVALFQDQLDLAALCAAIAGGLLAFLWFNIPPARFYLSETGTMGLTLTLVVVAFLTDGLGGGKGVLALPIIALPLVVTVLSNIAQILSKKIFGKKLLRVAPLHHHFEALGWPSYKVVMRYWIVGVVSAIIGMTIALL
jgi:phospho-N-acetylmuramoyl-pentapeptide-transferase